MPDKANDLCKHLMRRRSHLCEMNAGRQINRAYTEVSEVLGISARKSTRMSERAQCSCCYLYSELVPELTREAEEKGNTESEQHFYSSPRAHAPVHTSTHDSRSPWIKKTTLSIDLSVQAECLHTVRIRPQICLQDRSTCALSAIYLLFPIVHALRVPRRTFKAARF